MLFNWFLAEDMSEVGLSWIDFFSIGHVCFGIGVFLFFSLFYTVPKHHGNTPLLSLLAVFIISLLMFIGWEIIENTLFPMLGWKFEGRVDSWPNLLCDIGFGIIGALAMWLFCHLIFHKEKSIWGYYLVGLIGFGLWLGVFMILRAILYT